MDLCLNEEKLAEILSATFRGNNIEVIEATKILKEISLLPEFPNVLFSLILNKNFSFSIRQSGIIYIMRLIELKNQANSLILFFNNFANMIQNLTIDFSPLLRKCSNQLVIQYYSLCFSDDFSLKSLNDFNISDFIFELLNKFLFKAGLYFANSYIKIISSSSNNTLPLYKTFSSSFILALHQLLILIQENNIFSNDSLELIDLCYHFVARAIICFFPDVFENDAELSFWLPPQTNIFNSFDNIHYYQFLANLPSHLIKYENKTIVEKFKNEISNFIFSSFNNLENEKLTPLKMKVLYKMIYHKLLQINVEMFIFIINNVIIPQFRFDNLLEYNYSTEPCWKDPQAASIHLFGIIIQNEQSFSTIFYDFFQEHSNQPNFIVSALDLLSYSTKFLYEINQKEFFDFLQFVFSIISSQPIEANAAFLKLLSKSNISLLSNDFIYALFCFIMNCLSNENIILRYFAAIASSNFINQLYQNNELMMQIYTNNLLMSNMNNLISLFFELEREFPTQMMASSILRIIKFFGKQISNSILPITKEVIDFFFYFLSLRENSEPAILFCSTLKQLIEIAEGDINFTEMILHSLLSQNNLASIQYRMGYDLILDIFTTLVYYSKSFLLNFSHIITFAFSYLSVSNLTYFADISSTIEMVIWKYYQNIPNENIIYSLVDPIVQFIISTEKTNEWASAANIYSKTNLKMDIDMSVIYPKMIFFLTQYQYTDKALFYPIIEYFICNHIADIPMDQLPFLYEIYLENATFPSFLNSIIKSYPFLPDNLKLISIKTAIVIIINHNSPPDPGDEYYEEEEDWDEHTIPSPQWYNGKELLSSFIQLCISYIEHSSEAEDTRAISNFLSAYA